MREPEVRDAAVLDPPVNTTGVTVIADTGQIHVPAAVVDLESFRRWTDLDEFPEDGNIWWLRGEVWADMSKEQIFTHVLMKGEICRVLGNLVKAGQLGVMLTDGVLLTNRAGDISGNPDGIFLSHPALDSDQVRLVRGKHGGFTELQGTPDMVLEVVSDSSVGKDTEVLFDAYWRAGIPEYWLVDARGDQLRFDIFRHGPKSYRRSAKKHGWFASAVFGKSFRLSAKTDKAGRPDYTLDVR